MGFLRSHSFTSITTLLWNGFCVKTFDRNKFGNMTTRDELSPCKCCSLTALCPRLVTLAAELSIAPSVMWPYTALIKRFKSGLVSSICCDVNSTFPATGFSSEMLVLVSWLINVSCVWLDSICVYFQDLGRCLPAAVKPDDHILYKHSLIKHGSRWRAGQLRLVDWKPLQGQMNAVRRTKNNKFFCRTTSCWKLSTVCLILSNQIL